MKNKMNEGMHAETNITATKVHLYDNGFHFAANEVVFELAQIIGVFLSHARFCIAVSKVTFRYCC